MTERLHFHFSLSCIGEGNSNPHQCSCLENPRDGGAWWAAVYGVAQNRTRLKRLSSSSSGDTETQPMSGSGVICLHWKHDPCFPVMGSIFWLSSFRCLASRKLVSFLDNFSPKNLCLSLPRDPQNEREEQLEINKWITHLRGSAICHL